MKLRQFAVLGLALVVASAAQAKELSVVTKIDQQVAAAWQARGIAPAAAVDDARFFRRIHLDLVGSLPDPDQVLEFLADPSREKRGKAIDDLLASPAYADHWSEYWNVVLMGRLTREAYVDTGLFKSWVHSKFEQNTSWDEFARQLLTAEGYNTNRRPQNATGDPPNFEAQYSPATNWFLKYSRSIPELSAATSKTFLGVQIQCAQCHDHKTEKWTQGDFRQFTAFFAKTWAVPYDKGLVVGKNRLETRDRWTVPPVEKYEAFFGTYKDYVNDAPKLLDGHEVRGIGSRRKALAEWMTAKDNPWFAKAVVNRMWAKLLGVGFVEPIDDFRPGNPPVLPEVLQLLADDFVQHGYDLKHLCRVITSTAAYQRACKAGGPPNEHAYWSHYPLKQLEAEELFDVVMQATDTKRQLLKNPKNYSGLIRNSFIRLFVTQMGTDDMAEVASVDETIPRALLFLNGALFNGATRLSPGLALSTVLDSSSDDSAAIERIYLQALSRKPSPAELKFWLGFVGEPRSVAHTAPPPSDIPTGSHALGVTPEIANAPADADFKELLDKARTGADFGAMRKRLKNNADAGLYVKALEAFAAEAPFQHLSTQGGGSTPREQAFEDFYWALLNSSEFLTNH